MIRSTVWRTLQVISLIVATALSGCASGYHSDSITGGVAQRQVSADVWWVGYAGNGFTTEETVQTYWLNRCAELTLAQGYDGFAIITPVQLTRADLAHGLAPLQISTRVDELQRYELTQKPQLSGSIRLLKRPLPLVPGRVFDAAELKAFLAPYVTGPGCGGGNVCPHVHRYLFPPDL